jgi:hypothetical protein
MDLEIAYNVSMSQVENMLLALKEIEW